MNVSFGTEREAAEEFAQQETARTGVNSFVVVDDTSGLVYVLDAAELNEWQRHSSRRYVVVERFLGWNDYERTIRNTEKGGSR